MGDVYEEKACCSDHVDHVCECGGNPEACECETVEVKPDHWAGVQEYWDTVHSHLDQAASDVRDAVTKGLTAAEPVFREKVAPVLADATAKLSELADNARKTTSEKAGFADADTTPTDQITTGLAGVATGLLGLSKSLAEWLSHHATTASEKPVKVETVETIDFPVEDVVVDDVVDDVTAVADILQQPVIVADGDIEVVNPE